MPFAKAAGIFGSSRLDHRMHDLDTAFAKAMSTTDGSFLGSLSEIADCVIVVLQV